MIIVSMGAGLGNQMFEYAFYMHLKVLYPNEVIKVDTRYAFPNAHNGIEIFDIFNIDVDVATKEEVFSLTDGYKLYGDELESANVFRKIVRKFKNKYFSIPNTMRIQADNTEYYSHFFNIEEGQSIYFLGPFANYHYFSEIQDIIKNIYRFPVIDDARNLEYASLIRECNSVSIHVRRGDYVDCGVELTSPSFYKEAISIIEKQEKMVRYFVFSDDVDYARELFPDRKRFILIEGNYGKNSFRDMQLMSLCKHNITANSTFSFWGAFLNANPNKLVLSPNLPYTGAKFPFVCDDWIII